MSKEQEATIRKFLEKISKMNRDQLEAFARNLYMSKDEMDQVVFKWVRAGVDRATMFLDKQKQAICCDGEVKYEEFD